MADNTIPISGADQQLASFPTAAFYYGFSVRETTGTAGATLDIYDGTSTAGELIESVSLAPNESERVYYEKGFKLSSGIYIDIVSGTMKGCVRVG